MVYKVMEVAIVTAWDDETINRVYDRNGGYCWHCGRKLSFTNYGIVGAKSAWEIDHSRPLSRGGTDHLNNLVPSCVECNRSKQDLHSREFGRLIE